jgi:hypothetical protein
MPLIWPVLTPEERAGADQPYASSAFSHLAGVFSALMTIAALAGMLLLRISTGRSPRRAPAENGASLHSGRARRAAWHDADPDYEPPLAPSDNTGTWPRAPEHAVEDTVPELLRQLQWRTQQHQLYDAVPSPAR